MQGGGNLHWPFLETLGGKKPLLGYVSLSFYFIRIYQELLIFSYKYFWIPKRSLFIFDISFSS